MSNFDKQALRKAAEKAGADEWRAFIDTKSKTYAVHTPGDNRCGDVVKWAGFDGQQKAANKARFIAAANPSTVLALLDELETKGAQISNLTDERDALREGAMGDAKHSNTRAAADIYFQLVEECEIPPGGSLVDYVDDMREKLKVAEKRIAELEGKKVEIKLPESFYPDGDIECPLVINEYQIIEAIVAADCKPIAVCPRCKRELDLSHKHDGAHYCHATGTGKGE